MSKQDEWRTLADRIAEKADWMLVFADTDEEVRLLQEAEAALRDAADFGDRIYALPVLHQPDEGMAIDFVYVRDLHEALTAPTDQEASK